MVGNPASEPLGVLLQFARTQNAGDPEGFRFEPQDYTLFLPGGATPPAHFAWTPAVLDDLSAVWRPSCDPERVQRLGNQLRAFLPARWADWQREIQGALEARRRVIITLRSSASELYALPWELLTLDSNQFIGEVDGILLRFEWPEKKTAPAMPWPWPETKIPPAVPPPRPEGGRILVAWSKASTEVPHDAHVRAITNACRAGFHRFDPNTDVLPNASLKGLVAKLEEAEHTGERIAVLHLLCHGAEVGSTCGLELDGEYGPAVADATDLRRALAPFARQVRLVVLSACDSGNPGALDNQLGSVAQELHRCRFQTVIASRFPLSVPGSVAFTERFYHELLVGPSSLETAFLAARKHVAQQSMGFAREVRARDWASLQLYARHQDGDDTRPVIVRPYRGLLAFQPEHQRFFFGRDKEIAEIQADLQALIQAKKPRFLVVAGASGTGKSSLVFAGAVPLLRSALKLAYCKMVPGSDPLAALDEALAQRAAGEPTLLVVDQFEEIFIQTTSRSARQDFGRRLWSLAAAANSGLHVLITLRVDFIGRCGELVLNDEGLRLDTVAYDESFRIFIAQLGVDQLRAIIEGPARQVGLELQPGLTDQLLKDVDAEPGALPLLEDALDGLWQRREDRWLTWDAYKELGGTGADGRALGGVVGALKRRADAVLEGLPPAEQVLARHLLLSLVAVTAGTALDSRLRVPVAKLRRLVAEEEVAAQERVLKALVQARLLVFNEDGKSPEVEVAHEALIRKWPRLRAWLDEDRAGLVFQRRVQQAAQPWEQGEQKDRSLLFHGAQLTQAMEWRKTWETRMGGPERRFLDASEAYRIEKENKEAERQRREREGEARIAEEQRQRAQQKLEAERNLRKWTLRAAVLLGALLIGTAVAGVQAYKKSIEADSQSRAAKKSAEEAQKNAGEAQKNADEARKNAGEAQKKAEEAHSGFLVVVAEKLEDDPTAAAVVLREAVNPDPVIWKQAATDALQVKICQMTLPGHGWTVRAVAFSPDGKRILAGYFDHSVRIWNADGSGSPLVLEGHEKGAFAVAFSPDGQKIHTGSEDGTARIRNLDGSGCPIVLKGHKSLVYAAAFSPDGKKILTGSSDHTARLWNADGSGAPVVLKGHEREVLAVAFSPDGKKVLTGSLDHTARLWNADGSGAPVVLKGHEREVDAVAFSPDGKKVVTGSSDHTARLWNADGLGSPLVFKGHESSVDAVAFSPDGKKIVTGSGDRTARLWNADGLGSPIVFKGHEKSVFAVAFSPDGQKIATGSSDHTVRLWNVHDSTLVLKRHEEVDSVAFSPDGKKIVTKSLDNTVKLWNADGSGSPLVFKGHESSVDAVAFSPDGKKLVTGSWDKTARLWNADGSGSPLVLKGHEKPVFAVAFSPDGQKIATGSDDHTVRLWNADGSGSPLVFKGHESSVDSVAFSPDGKKILTGSRDSTARLWNADGSGSPLVFKGHESSVDAVAFSPDGKKLVTGSWDKTARLWNADGSGSPPVLKGHEGTVSAVMFSPDGRKLVTVSHDRTARLWNADGLGSPLVLKEHRDSVVAVAFNPDGQKLVTYSQGYTARLWLISSEALQAALWDATSDCLSENRRQRLFGESQQKPGRDT